MNKVFCITFKRPLEFLHISYDDFYNLREQIAERNMTTS